MSSRSIANALFAALLAAGLSSCFSSDAPLVGADQAAFLAPTIVYTDKRNNEQSTLVRDGDAYVDRDADGKVQMNVRLMEIGSGLYVAEAVPADGDGTVSVHAVLKLDLATGTADAYAMIAPGDYDPAPGMHRCSKDEVCIDDLNAYVAYAKATIAAGNPPDTQYAVVLDEARQCDLLAASPSDPELPSGVAGVAFDALARSTPPAIAACQAAVAADPTSHRSLFELGRAFDAAADYASARQWYQKAVDAGDAFALTNLGILTRFGQGGPPDFVMAHELFARAANLGDPQAMNQLGMMTESGQGGSADPAAARQWYAQSAARGNIAAAVSLGQLLRAGSGGAEDDVAARQWFSKAAAAGDADAEVELGYMLLNGQGGSQDDVGARDWFSRAADAGDSFGMERLAWMLMAGRGGPQDDVAARDWAAKAAATGDAYGMTDLGFLLLKGRGGAEDDPTALKWFAQAAAKGNATAMTDLAEMYLNGEGTPPNPVLGKLWMQKGAAAGNSDAQAWVQSDAAASAKAISDAQENCYWSQSDVCEKEMNDCQKINASIADEFHSAVELNQAVCAPNFHQCNARLLQRCNLPPNWQP